MLRVTTSWDDGDILDTKLAQLLSKYGFKGTFYIAKEYRPESLGETEIHTIAAEHEIGAHTLTHPDLSTLSREAQEKEIAGSKQWLEKILNKEVGMFCYPAGYFNETSVEVVKEAGFIGARTTLGGQIQEIEDPYRMATTIQVYPFPFRKNQSGGYVWRQLLEPFHERASALRLLGIHTWALRSWQSMARATFDVALAKGGVFHLWGHSWEIDQYAMWDELESFLAYAAGRSGYLSLTNGEVIAHI